MSPSPRDAPVPSPIGPLHAFETLRRAVGLYPPGHDMIRRAVDDLCARLEDAFRDREELRIEVVGGVAHAGGYPFRAESRALRPAFEPFERLGIGCIELERGVRPEELIETAELLHEFSDTPPDRPLSRLLASRGVRKVRLTRLVPVDTRHERYRWPDEPPTTVGESYAAALDAARATVEPVFEGAPLKAAPVEALLDRIAALVDDPVALGHVLAVKRYENHTFCHSVNVAALALLLGRRLGLDGDALVWLVEGALLHDIGKRRIPKEILGKAGGLSRREWRVMQRHPVAGAEMLVGVPGLAPVAPTIALEHHCHFDGGGYPDLAGEAPHPLSRLVAVVDTYEALTGARPYREPLLPEDACMMLARMAGEKLDPALVRAFVGLITFFPVGSVVRTDRNDVGVVVETSEREPLHPVIETLEPRPRRRRIDTADRGTDGAYLRHVVETLPRSLADADSEARAASA